MTTQIRGLSHRIKHRKQALFRRIIKNRATPGIKIAQRHPLEDLRKQNHLQLATEISFKKHVAKKLPNIPLKRCATVMVAIIFTVATTISLFTETAQAAISLRGSGNASVADRVAYVNSSANDNAGGTGSLALTVPTGVAQNDVMLAGLTIRGGTGTSITTVPSGWTLLDQKRDSTTVLTQVVYWKRAGASESGTAYTWNFTSNKASGAMSVYRHADPGANPINVSLGQVNASSTTYTAPSITTTVANTMLVGFFGGATSGVVSSSAVTVRAQDESTGGGATSRTVTAVGDVLQATAAATGTKTATGSAAVNIGHLIAIIPNAGTSLSLSQPTGTVQGDMLIASITISGNTTFTAPAGWNSTRRTVTAGNEIATETWYKVVGASETGPYSWSWSGGQRASGVIIGYSGVDTAATPISNGQANVSGTTLTAPTVTPTISNSYLVAVFGVNNAGTITGLSPITDQSYASVSGTTNNAIRISDQLLSAATATGTRTATAGTAGVSNGHLIALAPAVSTLTQSSHRWMAQEDKQAGTEWIVRYGASSDDSWESIAYGNGVYVAVGSGTDRVMTSPDGVNWTARSAAGNDDSWRNIAYGNGLFVAVSQGTDRVMTSPDGVNWTARSAAGNDDSWYGITYGNNQFLAVAQSGTDRVMTSPDGVNWSTQSAVGNDDTWHSVTYGNNMYIAVGGGTDRVMTSPDGINWTARSAGNGSNDAWKGIAYGDGLFVAVAQSFDDAVITSSDGETWTSRSAAGNNDHWTEVIYANEQFVAVGTGSSQERIMTSDAQMHATASSWTSRVSTSTSANQWESIAFGNNKYVAVGSLNDAVLVSSDGLNWTSQTSISGSSGWRSITYGNGLFVAVSTASIANQIMTSPDGVQWTARSAPAANEWRSVTYGNGLFVAVATSGTDNRIMTSADGITWTARSSATLNHTWWSVTYGNGLFVAVACGLDTSGVFTCNINAGNRVMTSSDGITWTGRTGQTQNWASVAYGNGTYVAGGLSGPGLDRIMTSPDGINWTIRNGSVGQSWRSISFGNGLFIAIANSNQMMTSPDGINWTTKTGASSNNWYGSVYGNGLFVAVSVDGTNNRVMTAPGIDASAGDSLVAQDAVLTNRSSDSVRLRLNIGVANRAFPAGDQKFALQYAQRVGAVCSASETFYDVGISPFASQSSVTSGWNSITYGNGLYVAVSSGTTGAIMTSPDGITWTSRNSPANSNWIAVTYGNGKFVAVSQSGSASGAMTSTDGINWTTSTTPTNQWYAITFGNGLFVAVAQSGTGNRVMTSPDGITWTSRSTTGFDIAWNSVTYGNGMFVAVAPTASLNSVMTSRDGISWSIRSAANTNAWNTVEYGNGLFVAASYSGTGNRIMTSPDGIGWTLKSSASDNFWKDISYGNGLFVAISNDGTNRVMTSPDGVNWTARSASVNNFWQSITFGNGKFVAVSSDGTNRVMTMIPPVMWGGQPNDTNGTVVANSADPTQGASTIKKQHYVSNNYFTAQFDTAISEFAQFDFDLNFSNAANDSSYCFRVTDNYGSVISAYSTYPEIAKCSSATLDRRLRHGTSFCGQRKATFWSRFSS